jgi:hypothetical protein
MSASEGDRACENCGTPLTAGASACAACGKFVPAGSPAGAASPLQPLAVTRMSRPAEILFGIVAGLVGGAVLAVALVLASMAIVGLASNHHVQAPFFVGIVVDLLVLVALFVFGIRSAARGNVFLGTSLIVAGIVAALPTVACDLMLYTMRTMQ